MSEGTTRNQPSVLSSGILREIQQMPTRINTLSESELEALLQTEEFQATREEQGKRIFYGREALDQVCTRLRVKFDLPNPLIEGELAVRLLFPSDVLDGKYAGQSPQETFRVPLDISITAYDRHNEEFLTGLLQERPEYLQFLEAHPAHQDAEVLETRVIYTPRERKKSKILEVREREKSSGRLVDKWLEALVFGREHGDQKEPYVFDHYALRVITNSRDTANRIARYIRQGNVGEWLEDQSDDYYKHPKKREDGTSYKSLHETVDFPTTVHGVGRIKNPVEIQIRTQKDDRIIGRTEALSHGHYAEVSDRKRRERFAEIGIDMEKYDMLCRFMESTLSQH